MQHVAVLLVCEYLISKRQCVCKELSRGHNAVLEKLGTARIRGAAPAVVSEAVEESILPTVIVDDVGEATEEADDLIKKIRGAGHKADDLDKTRVKAGQGAELVVADAKGFVDVRRKRRV